MRGAAPDEAWVLNRGDRGLLASLEALSAEAASARPGGRSSIAAHVDHLRYGIELLNRWASGEDDPFAAADYSASWRRQNVSDTEWRQLRDALARDTRAWEHALLQPRSVDLPGLTGMLASVVHLAYHLGAIRQINLAAAGPPAQD
jgi:hypothetical protein